MANVISVKEAAMRWGISRKNSSRTLYWWENPRRYQKRTQLAYPAGAEKPVDNRIKTGAYVRAKAVRNTCPCQSVCLIIA